MRLTFIRTLVISLFCIIIVSCGQWGSNKETVNLMQQAQQLVEQMPDSALVLLDSINTSSFSGAEKAEYTLLRIQAKDNAELDLSTDTEIFQVREYFINEKDEEKKALACFYSAKVAAADDADAEMKYYQEALDYVRKTDNKLLQGKILYNMGFLDFDRRWYSDAISWFMQALKVFRSIDAQYQREIYSLNAIGNSFLAEQQTDSAKRYYDDALSKARLNNDHAMLVIVCNNVGVAYREQGKYDAAEYYCRRALHLAISDNENVFIYRNLTEIFVKINKLDSAIFYLAKAEPLFKNMDNTYALASLTELRYQIEKKLGNYQKSLEHCELYTYYQKEISNQQDRQVLLEMQRKYNNTTKENEYHKEINKWWKIVAGLSFSLLLLVIVYVRARIAGMKQKVALANAKQEKRGFELTLEKAEREKKEKELALEKSENEKKERELELEKEKLVRKENELLLEKTEREKKEKELALEKLEREKTEQKLELEKTLKEKQEKELELEKTKREKAEKQLALEKEKQEKEALKKRGNKMQSAFLEKMDIIRKLVFSSQYLEENKVGVMTQNFIKNIKPIISNLTLQKFMVIANELCPGLTDNLSSNLSNSLTKREIEVCCLIVCGFSNEEIAIFINKKKNTQTIEKWKNIIRRKLGIEAYGNIQEFLLNKISIQ